MEKKGEFMGNLVNCFSIIPDPRIERSKLHKLVDILIVAVSAVICGAESWVEIEEFGKTKEKWFKQFLELPHGIPSHDTFSRVFSMLNPRVFERSFGQWVSAICPKIEGLISIDGKSICSSSEKIRSTKPIHIVRAWSYENKVILGQVRTKDKSNEITAIPELLKTLYLKGCIVSIDAMGCQKKIAAEICKHGADYVLALKHNHKFFHQDVSLFLNEAKKLDFEGVVHDYYETIEKNHGRIETRRYWVTSQIDGFKQKKEWQGLCCIGMVEAKRETSQGISVETRYYITSLRPDAKKFAYAVRGHWDIENALHWTLDVSFGEDSCKIRNQNSAENFSILRAIGLNLLKNEKTSKIGVKAKRLKAGWSSHYLAKVLDLQKI